MEISPCHSDSRFPALPHLTLLTLALLLMALAATVPAKPPGGGGNPPPPPLPTYTLQSLGTLGGATSTAEGINDFGDVVGVSDLADGTTEPYLYTSVGGMQSINTLTEGPGGGATFDIWPRRPAIRPGRWRVCPSNGGRRAATTRTAASRSLMRHRASSSVISSSLVPAGSSTHISMTFGVDGDNDLYIASRSGVGTEISRIAQFDGSTGAFKGDFVTDQGPSLEILGLSFGPDVGGGTDGDPDGVSDLFVTSNRTHEVLVFSGADGQALGPFVTAGSGGLDSPQSLTFHDIDDDGVPELFVSALWNCEVLMYDGLDGSFLGVFADSAQILTYANSIKHIEFGPDDSLYIGARSRYASGYPQGSHVLRVDSATGTVEVFVEPRSGGWSTAVLHFIFDEAGDVYATSGDTAEILRFQGPFGPAPGEFIDVLVEGVRFTLITARDINDAGQIVGVGYPQGRGNLFGQRAAYRYTPPGPGKTIGRVEDLHVPNLSSAIPQEATAINNEGDVAGHFYADDGLMHAFLWPTETPATEDAIDLGTLAGGDTYVTAISDRVGGDLQVAGYAETASGYRAWRYNTATGTMQNLGLISGSERLQLRLRHEQPGAK